MIRRPPDCHTGSPAFPALAELREQLLSRRQFLLRAAGGSLAVLFNAGATARSSAQEDSGQAPSSPDPWPTLDAVTAHLLPSETDSPGAKEINAVGYLRFVVNDPHVDSDERAFVTQGVIWLNQLSHDTHHKTFSELGFDDKESMLRRIAASEAGENWLSTLLTYLFEALLTAPAYGGNPDGIGWRWLQYVPGFPLPDRNTIYSELPL
ncbi:gluconate 2-dehydrogenase subunit 3 family protein [Thiosocius teredinicola]|uniref:gluconate 2-dehydrogenase subunit 3 family protein n=1 Tax=Thiosocius teredinicola TaxID=1973002 RepID=UPI000990F81B